MSTISLDFSKTIGKIKPMHAVNNGPVYKHGADQRLTNMQDYIDAGIPYARNHDASFNSTYGINHTVDVDFIFTDFDADPYDEASYDFTCTDEYIRVTALGGAETFYRLGSRIEHQVKKYNTLPPKDYKKWAIICEHIIKHYNYGWANGFNYNLKYWEIWNEPDLDDDASTNKRNWGGTKDEFFELYRIAATHLKECFPELKIGGPALAWRMDWAEDFIKYLSDNKIPLDFFSWHRYAKSVEKIEEDAVLIRNLLDKYGFVNVESINNEWNYVKGWEAEEFLYSIKTISNLKGAAFVSAVMNKCQSLPVDMLMYYDARPCGFNGLWAPYTYEKQKPYWSIYAFNILYKLSNEIESTSSDSHLYVSAAKDDNSGAAIIAHFDDDNDSGNTDFVLDIKSDYQMAHILILDNDRDLEEVECIDLKNKNKLNLSIAHNSVMVVRFER